MSRTTTADDRSSRRRLIFGSVVGSVIEWYDLSIYGQASALVLGGLFFPGFSPLAGLLASFATFAVGFFARPLGGLFFAHIGDRWGRRPALVATLLTMGIATTLIGLLPTYATVGVLAPVLLVALRVCQGAGAGAEYAGATSMVAEYAPEGRRGLQASLPVAGMFVGIGLAAAVSALMASLPQQQLTTWGWRVPFLLSILVVGVGMFLRMRVLETPVFREVKEQRTQARLPLGEVLRRRPGRILIAMGAAGPTAFNIYIIQVFVLSYVAQRGLGGRVPLVGLLLGCVLSVFVVPLAGMASDRFGRRPVYMAVAGFGAAFSFPMFWLLDTDRPVLVWVAMALGFAGGCCAVLAVQASFLSELFDTRTRFTGIVFSREITVAALAAPAPFIATALTNATGGDPWPIALLMTLVSLLAVVAAAVAPETYRSSLSGPTDVPARQRQS